MYRLKTTGYKFTKVYQIYLAPTILSLIHVACPFNAQARAAGAHALRAQKGKQRVAILSSSSSSTNNNTKVRCFIKVLFNQSFVLLQWY